MLLGFGSVMCDMCYFGLVGSKVTVCSEDDCEPTLWDSSKGYGKQQRLCGTARLMVALEQQCMLTHSLA